MVVSCWDMVEECNSASTVVLPAFPLEVSMDESSYVPQVVYHEVSSIFLLHGPSFYNNYTRDAFYFGPFGVVGARCRWTMLICC